MPEPVKVEKDKIAINEKILEIGKQYPIEYRGKKYFVYKPEKDKTVLYEIIE